MVDFLFEVSSEAGLKVGGIYTVLRSKSEVVHKKFGDNYLLIGYYEPRCEESDFEYAQPPEDFVQVFRDMGYRGIVCRYGHWLKGDNSNIIMIDASRFCDRLVTYTCNGANVTDRQINKIKAFMWEKYKVDSLYADDFYDKHVPWAYATGKLIEQIMALPRFKGKKVIAHFHEWIAGAGLLYLHDRKVPVGKVFTTHATTLGRSIYMAGRNTLQEAYNAKGSLIDQSEAQKFGVQAKHTLEVASARYADAFTTVSETVSVECEYILGKKPDVITLNGFNFDYFERKNKTDKLAKYVRAEMLQFLESYFSPYYKLSYENPLVVCIAARYEFINKGFDVFINALGKLNRRIKGSKRPVFALILTQSDVRGPKPEIISNYLILDKVEEVLNGVNAPAGTIEKRLKGIDRELAGDIKAMIKSFKKIGTNPPISCFQLNYPEENDSIIRACIENGLANSPEDTVKVVFYPNFVSPTDGLLAMSYYDFLGGPDVGVFPSRYEPYGLTPVEAAAKNNISITSDTTGFGRFVMDKVDKNSGMTVIKMLTASFEASTDELANELERVYRLTPEQLSQLKENAFNKMKIVDWSEMIKYYYQAYEMAIKKSTG
ncbi:MAG: glycogen/starch synthase [Candidatus Micrarchaeota archaeon]|nr:glycogen/starch synthase [Candidatus Micrarchaeota archaeon]